ncbi:MAG: hypothetical protein Q8N96_04470 [Methylovulum sp.]|nr:hypothetical protein [Methylovulum sp.]
MNKSSMVFLYQFNLFGRFEFSPSMSKADIGALVSCYADPAYWSKTLSQEVERPLS